MRRFLDDWIDRMRPIYLTVPLEPSLALPGKSAPAQVLERCVLPAAGDHGLPVCLLIGFPPSADGRPRVAGHVPGPAALTAVTDLCTTYSRIRFLATALSRENQHELTVIARQFPNLHLFGCWWMASVPSLAVETTGLRVELLGHNFTPHHSGARVLEQLIYRWHDARQWLARVLADKYAALLDSGWSLTEDDVHREISDLLGRSAMRFIRGKRAL
jgi:hypothetical protein